MSEHVLNTAAELSKRWLGTIDEPPVFPTASNSELGLGLDLPLMDEGIEPATVLKELAAGASPGLVKSAGGRYFGFVTAQTAGLRTPGARSSDGLWPLDG